MKSLCVLFSCLGFLLPLSSALSAKVNDYTFTHLGMDEGVVGPHIFNICQTKDGVVWWSTKNTVDRYNGSSVRNYYLDADVPYNRFSGRVIGLVISNDAHSSLYAFDNNGKIFLYNRINDDFLPVADLELMLGRPVILYHIYVDEYGIWVALSCGVYRMEGAILHPVLAEPTRYIMAVGEAYLFCTKNGAYLQKGLAAPATLFSPFRAESAYYDKGSGRIWLGTFSDGVKVVDDEGVISVHNLPNNPVRCIIADSEENMLVGVDGFGVYMIPSKGDRLSASLIMHANEGEQGVLHGNGVYSLLKDIWGNIFIGTYSGGVDIARPTGGIVEIFRPNNKHINSVNEIPGWGIVLGTDDGLSVNNDKSGKWKNLADGLVVLDVCEDKDGGLLLATYGKGVFHISKGGVISQRYSLAGGELRDDHVYSLYRSSDGHLWIGCLGGDVVEVLPDGFRYYPVHNVLDIIQLPDGRMAVGSAHGIWLLKSGSSIIEELLYAPKGEEETANRFVFQLCADGNRLWIASDGGGIYIFDMENGTCKQLTKKEGLPSNAVCSLVKGEFNTFWAGTESGLCRISTEGELTPLNHLWGLNREFIGSASFVRKDGSILLGTTDGAVLLRPGKVEAASYNAPLHLTGLRFKASNEEERLEKTARLMGENPKLELGYRQNTFELYFESVNLRYQQDIVYQYRIGRGDWSLAMPNGMFRFVEVESGTHIIEVRSLSRSSQKVLHQTSITVSVGQPWWNSWWMWLVYMSLVAGTFIGSWKIYQLRSRYMRLILTNPVMHRTEAKSKIKIHPKDGTGVEFVNSATRVVANHLSDSDFSIDCLCREMGMSRTYLYVRLRTFTGKSPQEFIRFIRLERAALMLREGASVSDVSAAVGFENPKYFSTVFKNYFGVSPSKY